MVQAIPGTTESSSMNFYDYQELANRTAKELNFKDGLTHAALGLTGEAGEFSDATKKHIIYGQNVDFANLREEIGDILWYCAYAANVLGFSLETIARLNIEKLAKRYPGEYSDMYAAQRMDKNES